VNLLFTTHTRFIYLIFTLKFTDMSIKKDCNNCDKKFDAKRVNALYCSDSCKTQAYQKRKVKKTQESEPKERIIFYGEEFESVRNLGWNSYINSDNGNDLDFAMFCFLRTKYKKKIGNSSSDPKKRFENLTEFIYGFIDSNEKFSKPRKTDAFKVFEEKFYSDEFEILESEDAENSVSEV
jgi:hypothetical protein